MAKRSGQDAVSIDEDEGLERTGISTEELRRRVLFLIDNDPEIRGKLVLEGELRPEAYKYPRITMVNGKKQKL